MKASLHLVYRTFFPRVATEGKSHIYLRMLLFGIMLLLLWLALRAVSFSEIWVILRDISPRQLLLLGLLNAIILFTMSARWWFFLNAQGHWLPWLALVRYRLAAFGLSYFTPGPHFGGEPLQVYLTQRHGGVPQPDAVAAVVLDKLVEMIFNFTFLALGVLYVLQTQIFAASLDGWRGAQSAASALLLLLIPALLLISLWRNKRPFSWLLRILPKAVARTAFVKALCESEERMTRLCRERPLALLWAFVISFLIWLGMIAEFWFATQVLGLNLSLGEAITALVAMRVAILLPLPAALGSLEASQTLAMSALGLSPAAGISLSLLIRGRDVIVGLLGLMLGLRDVALAQTAGDELE